MRQDRLQPFDGRKPGSIDQLSAAREVEDTWLPVAGPAGRTGGAGLRGRPGPLGDLLRRTGDTADPLGGQRIPGDVMEVLRRSNGHGDRLPADVESGMGRQFGMDLSPVRIHGDQEADGLARSMQATAFTHGRDIYFSRGSYSPGSPSGRRLLAHELAHATADQGGAASGPVIGHANDPAERDADRTADRVMAGLTTGPDTDAPVTAFTAAGEAEPIARTIRRNRVKDMVNQAGKAVRPRRAKKAKPAQLGGASIADLEAASNDAHATNGRLGGAPLGHLRAATHAHDTPTHLGETRSKRSRKSSHAAVSGPASVRVRDRFGQAADTSPESTEEEATSTGAAGPASAAVQQQVGKKYYAPDNVFSYEGSSSESSDEELSSPGPESDSSSSEWSDEGSESSGEENTSSASSEKEHPSPGAMVADSSPESSEEEATSTGAAGPASAAVQQQVGKKYYAPDDAISYEGSASESSDDELSSPGPQSDSSSESSEEDLIPPAAAVAGHPAPSTVQKPAENRRVRPRAFLKSEVHSNYANETKGMNDEQQRVVEGLAEVIKNLAHARRLLSQGRPLARVGMILKDYNTLSLPETEKNRKKVAETLDAKLKELREFARRQEIPVDRKGRLGDVSDRHVHYDNPEEQKQSVVTAKSGLLHRAGGEPVDTAGSSTYFSKNGVEIFVVSLTGELHMGSHKIGKYHHSSLLGGQNAAFAGEMKVNNGRIEWMSGKSGHYMPTKDQLIQFLHWLKKDGVALDFAIRGGFEGGDIPEYPIAGAALDPHGFGGSPEFHNRKLHTVLSAYRRQIGPKELDDFLETLGWEIGDDGDIMDSSTGEDVDDDVAIKALKKGLGIPPPELARPVG